MWKRRRRVSRKIGLKENLPQFLLLVLVNAFVGGMVGLERSILPQIAEVEFGMAVKTAILSFIIVFGIVKAFTNYFMGRFANRYGRKRLLIAGWLFALPVPFLLMYAQSWSWIIWANVFLGINQGLAWSSTIIMKIDLVGPKNRGFAMGINESAGYLAVGMMAFISASIASKYGLHPYPFYLAFLLLFLGLFTSIFFVKDTSAYVAIEEQVSEVPRLKKVFQETTLTNSNLSSITLAGLVNNLNDGMMWGLLPLMLAAHSFSLTDIGFLVALYPTVWGLGQLFTGALADKYSKKILLVLGMSLQAIGIFIIAYFIEYTMIVFAALLLGFGTALVYPTFLAAIADYSHPQQRAECIGVYRLWRDLGYAIGALGSGIIADIYGLKAAFVVIAFVTLIAGIQILFRMR
ncbi:MFS transporter [Flavobacteriales bacterium]|nr:MFS transporter [Flavobacteriales bacterium]